MDKSPAPPKMIMSKGRSGGEAVRIFMVFRGVAKAGW
jgi:hypothetical protein